MSRGFLWILCSVVFHALTLKLPIETSVSVAPKLPVSLSSREKFIRLTSECDTCLSLGGQYGPFALGDSNTEFYHPQTKFAKVMFLHLSVSHSIHRGWGVPGQVHRYIPPGIRYTPPGLGTPPRTRYTPWDQVQPPGPGTSQNQIHPLLDQVHLPRDQVHPPRTRYTLRTRYTHLAVHAGRYGQQAGGTHPTGMYSCSQCKHVVRDGWHCH